MTAGYVVTVTPAGFAEAERAVAEARRALGCGYPSGLTPQQKAGQVSGRHRTVAAAERRLAKTRQLSRKCDTVSDVQAYASGLLDALLQWPKHKKASKLAADWLWLELPNAELPSTHTLPNGSSISVERVEDGGGQ